MLEVQEDIVRSLLQRRGRAISRFLDLGCGDGALTQLMVDLFPAAEAVMVDFSEPMLARAGERLRRLRITSSLWRADLNDPAWSAQLPDARYDAIVSGLAIHHLPAERKRSLFAELFGMLEPGGVFVNLDFVLIDGPLAGLFDEYKLKALRPQGGAADAAGAGESEGAGETAGAEQAFIDEDDDDRPDTAEDQVAWLREAGFEQAAIQFKWAEAAVMAGFKPDREEK